MRSILLLFKLRFEGVGAGTNVFCGLGASGVDVALPSRKALKGSF